MRMGQQDTIAVIGAGIIGSAVALRLAGEGRRVLLLDRDEPGLAGASYGNVGHIAAELVQPLPSPQLLFGFWRQLRRFGGALDLPLSRAWQMRSWVAGFARAAFRRAQNTVQLSPLVKPAAMDWQRWLTEIHRPELLRRHGHYEVWFGERGRDALSNQAAAMQELGVKTSPVEASRLSALCRAANQTEVHGLWFEDSAHVIDPLKCVEAFVDAATGRGASLQRFEVRRIELQGAGLALHGPAQTLQVGAAVICAGMGSQRLLAPLGAHAPLQSVRGYHVELPQGEAFLDAPVVYVDHHLLVTPMQGRLRASSYMEFAAADAPPDLRKLAGLRAMVRNLGYRGDAQGDWVGARPILPDYLPGIGRCATPAPLFYAVGHHHIGLTLAPITGDLMADLVAQRAPRMPVSAFDLKRFGAPPMNLTNQGE
jgi:D-amino-acid dehydrogenase